MKEARAAYWNAFIKGANEEGRPEAIDCTDGAAHTLDQGLGAGERNVDSATAGYQVVRQECNITICDGTSAVTIGAGGVGDTHLMGILIPAAATAITATIAGFTKKDNADAEAAGTITLTGPDIDLTATDMFFDFKGAINDNAALTVTGSVDEKVVVFWRPV